MDIEEGLRRNPRHFPTLRRKGVMIDNNNYWDWNHRGKQKLGINKKPLT